MEPSFVSEKSGSVSNKLSPSMIVEKLRAEATSNPVFNAMCHAFAVRERTRRQLTIHNLFWSLKKEGFKYAKEDYANVLKFMGSLGLGTLQTDRKGNPKALKNISITLQSIGLAALSKKGSDGLKRWVPTQPFSKLPKEAPQPVRQQPAIEILEEPVVVKDDVLRTPLKENQLKIQIGYKTFLFELFPESKTQDLLDLVDRLYKEKAKKA